MPQSTRLYIPYMFTTLYYYLEYSEMFLKLLCTSESRDYTILSHCFTELCIQSSLTCIRQVLLVSIALLSILRRSMTFFYLFHGVSIINIPSYMFHTLLTLCIVAKVSSTKSSPQFILLLGGGIVVRLQSFRLGV